MPERNRPSVRRVTVTGFFRGAELEEEADLELMSDAIEIRGQGLPRTIPYAMLEGVTVRRDRIEIAVGPGDLICVSEGSAESLSDLARELEWQCCALPEVTRSLRGLGSRRASPGTEHDRFFTPFLAGRRRAEAAGDVSSLLAAFDAAKLREELAGFLESCASARYGRRTPEWRAAHAALSECAIDLEAAMSDLDRTGQALRSSKEIRDDDARFAMWRMWGRAVRRVFESADECWFSMRGVLSERAPKAPPWWRRWLRLGSAAVVAVFAPVVAGAQHVTVRVAGANADSLRARGFDVVFSDAGGPLVVADNVDRARLTSLGLEFSTVFAPSAGIAQRVARYGPTATSVYRQFDDPVRGIGAFLDSLRQISTMVHVDTIGFSIEGRPLIIAKIGSRSDSRTRPNVLFMATYHAREWAATEMALRLLRYLVDHNAQGASPDPRIDSLVTRNDIWILPVANPDGYQFTFSQDRLWRKNRRANLDGSFGVDLNRNHATHWGLDDVGSSPTPASEVYRGTAAESEPEIRAIAAFHSAHPPVLSVSYHTFTGLILYPLGHDYGELAEDLGVFRALAGTDVQPSVRDRLPGSNRDHYHPAPGWNLYETNGEYTDWAYTAHGAIAFTPELSSGFEHGTYYGFEFPDDETRLQTLFADNLPFALDVIAAAVDPLRTLPIATGIPSELIGLESIFPSVRLRVPLSAAGRTTVRAPEILPLSINPQSPARYTRRLVATPPRRPLELAVESDGLTKRYQVLAANGAEPGEHDWLAEGFTRDTTRVAGSFAWTAGLGTLRSPAITVPAGTDSISVLFWTRYFGDPFSLVPRGEILFTSDGGASWTVAGLVSGAGPVYYPERLDITGVAGRTIQVQFSAAFGGGASVASWWVDEIAIVGHTAGLVPGPVPTVALRPTSNPVRGDVVGFEWPFGQVPGSISVFDFAGRLVWRQGVNACGVPGPGCSSPAQTIVWDIAESRIINGAYVVVAQSGSRISRLTLFIVRSGS
ncbi:MAG: M14 family metallopeptidase [Gemmatimonadaceae bacterium]